MHGTFGVLKIDKRVFCYTLEPPDIENASNVSSIPAQQYICSRTKSPTFGETFEVLGVPDRSNILFHPGNIVSDTAGCILLGRNLGTLGKDRAIMSSGDTFRSFMTALVDDNDVHLTIKEVY